MVVSILMKSIAGRRGGDRAADGSERLRPVDSRDVPHVPSASTDVLPVDDLGIVNAVQRLYKLRKRPDAKKLRALGEAWKPYRSVASWYLWQSLKM